VSLLDVAPTVLDLLRLAPNPAYRGTSVVAAARGETDALAGRPLFAEVDRVERAPIRGVSVRRGGATAILDLEHNTTRCYAAEDRDEQHPTASCPDLEALIAEHRRTAAPIAAPSPTAIDPRLVEKMRALGYIE
jgi:arylsulfatase A-like enzyme